MNRRTRVLMATIVLGAALGIVGNPAPAPAALCVGRGEMSLSQGIGLVGLFPAKTNVSFSISSSTQACLGPDRKPRLDR